MICSIFFVRKLSQNNGKVVPLITKPTRVTASSATITDQ